MKIADASSCAGSLAGQVALVTGGAQGIGRAIAERFQQAGSRVCILDCDSTTGEATAEDLTARNTDFPVTFVRADLAKPGEIQSAMQEVHHRYEKLDLLVNNAGVEQDKPFPQMSVEAWDNMIGINLRAPFFLTQAALPLFSERGGAVINISSIHSTHAFPDSTTYACSKAGLVALTRNLALELAPRRIRVNAICPGYIDTRLWEEYVQQAPHPADLADRVASLHPVGRRGLPEDVANAAWFLATEASSFISGTHLVVDGGLTIRTAG